MTDREIDAEKHPHLQFTKAPSGATLSPTSLLRWNKGVLEQAWNYIKYVDGNLARQSLEWRPIPENDES